MPAPCSCVPGAEALHPLGLLRLTQTAAPLDVPLAKFGANAVTSGDPVTVAITVSRRRRDHGAGAVRDGAVL